MCKRLLLLLVMTFSLLSVMAGESKYEGLVNRSNSLPTPRLMTKADSLQRRGDDEEAVVLYMMVAARQQKNASQEELSAHVNANLNIGNIHYQRGNYAGAIKFFMAAMKLSDSMESRPKIAVLYKNIGNVYNVFSDYDMGCYFYKKGLKAAREQGDTDTEYRLLQNLAAASMRLGKLDAARSYYDEIGKVKHTPTSQGRYMDKFILALLLHGEGRSAESVKQLKEVAAFAQHNNLPAKYLCDAYDEIARIEKERGNKESAIYYLNQCIATADSQGILHLYVGAMKSLESLYDEMGDVVQAQKIKDRYLQVKDSIYDQLQFDMTKKQQFLYEMEKTEKIISDLNERQRQSDGVIGRQRWMMLFAFIGIVVASLLIYYFYRQKQRLSTSYRTLYALNRELAATHKESKEQQRMLRDRCDVQANEISDLRERLTALEHDGNATRKPSSQEHRETRVSDEKYKSSNLQDGHRDRLSAAIAAVMEDDGKFTATDFTLGVLADMVGSNAKYVSQVINDVYKKNFNTFINEYRIRLACERLADFKNFGHYSIRGIGESVGFKSYTSFTTVFKKITGISPSMYQKLSAEEAG